MNRTAFMVSLVAFWSLAGPSGQARGHAGQENALLSEQEIQAHNAARLDNGGRVTLELIGPEAGQDRRNVPEESADGDVHTRCVVWGAPYVFRIELVDTLPVTEVHLLCSDYALEESPKEIELRLSDGTVIPRTLERLIPQSRQDKPRQTFPIGKDLAWIEVKVLSSYPGGPRPDTGEPVRWGGIGEIEVITRADLMPYLQIPDYNPEAPVYVEGGSPKSDYSHVKVPLPTPIPLGQHPGIYLTRNEIVQMRQELQASERARPMLDKLLRDCNEWLGREIVGRIERLGE